MSELRKTYAGGLFYLTFTVVGWADVFTRKIYTDELVKNLIYCQEKKDLEIFAFVGVPSATAALVGLMTNKQI